MTVIYGISDKEKEKINLLFDNVEIITAGENKVFVNLKGICEFDILPEEHQSKPSYVSGLPYAYQYFKSKGRELDFNDLVNLKVTESYYKGIPEIARRCLIKILENEKLNTVYLGLKGEEYLGPQDRESRLLYESSKAFGTKSPDELTKIQQSFFHSLLDGGFARTFNDFFGKDYLSSDDNSRIEFGKRLFDSIRLDSFNTSIEYGPFDLSSGFRGNEYIRLLQSKDKYKLN